MSASVSQRPNAPPSESPFHLEQAQPGFESLAHTDGFKFWWASDIARLMGYEGLDTFRKAINKAMIACDALGVPLVENFVQERRVMDGREQLDFRLSRFACYLAAMNGNVNNPRVAEAQAYFVTFAEACRLYLERAENVERVGLRADISDRERSLSGVAQDAGLLDFALFQNAGYRGLYNMDVARLRQLKGLPDARTPLDFMGKEELAANLFRITQTEAKIRRENRRGQQSLERAAEEVGRRVRQTMEDISGNRPEELAPASDIKVVRKKLKSAQRGFRKLDQAKPPKRLTGGSDQDVQGGVRS
jgi:DNA-damage-inducible protein D